MGVAINEATAPEHTPKSDAKNARLLTCTGSLVRQAMQASFWTVDSQSCDIESPCRYKTKSDC
jgi:hypothetical protein